MAGYLKKFEKKGAFQLFLWKLDFFYGTKNCQYFRSITEMPQSQDSSLAMACLFGCFNTTKETASITDKNCIKLKSKLNLSISILSLLFKYESKYKKVGVLPMRIIWNGMEWKTCYQ